MKKKILQFVEDNVGNDTQIERDEGNFWNIHEDRSVASWGWNEPLEFEGYRIVYLIVSPAHKGAKQSVYFDYITDEKYQKDHRRIKQNRSRSSIG